MRFWSDSRGNIAVIFALLLCPLMACLGLAVDYTVWTNQKQELQRIADQAATAAARELYLANSTASQAEAVADSVAKSEATASDMLSASADSDAAPTGGTDGSAGTEGGAAGSAAQATTFGGAVSVFTKVDTENMSVQVTVSQYGETYFSQMFFSAPEIVAVAVARAAGGGRICVIGLDDDAYSTISLTVEARLSANQCGVFSNSTSAGGITSYKNSELSAELICSAGGFDGGSINFSDEPVTDCPPIPDPLAGRAAPSYAGCDETGLQVTGESRTLSPGVYCGGLLITGNSLVDFAPGVYIMKDGPLEVTHTSVIRGEHVGFYFTGDKSVFLFASGSEVDLTAPADGPMAGLLFFEDRNAPELRHFEITSDNARVLVGTIYLPNGIFSVSSKKPVADQSAYTAIVARQIKLNKYPDLHINANYNQTDVPVPSGLGPSSVGRTIYLAK